MSIGFAKKQLVTGSVFAATFLAFPSVDARQTTSSPAAVAESTADQALQNYMEMCREGVPDIASDMLDMRAEGATRAQVKRDALSVYDDGLKKHYRYLNDLKTRLIRRGLTRRGATAIIGAMGEMAAVVYGTLPDMADAVSNGDRGRRWSKRRFRSHAQKVCMDRIGLVTERLAQATHTASVDAPSGKRAWGQCVAPDRGADVAVWSNFEQCLRIRRFKRLSGERGEKTPNIESLAQEGLLDYPIPAIRISWSDSVFFDTDEDEVLENAKGKLHLVADAMDRDVGDVHLFVIGHTDDTGGYGYNQELSERRALNVLRELSALGVRDTQMTAAGMGELQPVATNHTRKGRAANRRVEFMISPYEEANFALTMARKVNAAFFRPLAIAEEETGRFSNGDEPSDLFAPPAEADELLAGPTAEVEVISLTEKKLPPLKIPTEHRREILPVPDSQG